MCVGSDSKEGMHIPSAVSRTVTKTRPKTRYSRGCPSDADGSLLHAKKRRSISRRGESSQAAPSTAPCASSSQMPQAARNLSTRYRSSAPQSSLLKSSECSRSNRHEAGNERVLRERSSHRSAPSFALNTARFTAKRKPGGTGGLGIELRKDAMRMLTLFVRRKANGRERYREFLSGPA